MDSEEDVHHAFLAEAYKEDRGKPATFVGIYAIIVPACAVDLLGRSVSNRHRLAPRPWHDRAFETLPQAGDESSVRIRTP